MDTNNLRYKVDSLSCKAGLKAVFLDIDGVLHPFDAAEPKRIGRKIVLTGNNLFGKACLLDRLIERVPDVAMVINGGWRSYYTLDELRVFLGAAGHRTIAATNDLIDLSFRAYPRYIYSEYIARILGCSKWIIVDDQPMSVWGDRSPTADQYDRTVICDPVDGLTLEKVNEAVRKLS